MKSAVFLAISAVSLLAATQAAARPASSLQDLIGARGSSGESALNSRGFTYYGPAKAGSGSVASLWAHKADGNCVKVVTKQGRYVTIVDTGPGMCGMTAGAHGASLSDLNGIDGIKAFDVMQSRGFTNVDTLTSGNDLIGIYWNGKTRQCAQVITSNNRVVSATDIHTHPKCH